MCIVRRDSVLFETVDGTKTMDVPNSLKAVSLKQFCDKDTLSTWLLPSLAGLAITGTAYWYYKTKYACQEGVTRDKPKKLSIQIRLHPNSADIPAEEEKELLKETTNTELLETPSENRLDVRYSEEDEEVYSILSGNVKKTASLPGSQEMLCSTKHLSRGDLPEDLSLTKYLSPSVSKDLSGGDKGSLIKEKGASQKCKKSDISIGAVSKIHTPKAVHGNVEKAQKEEKERKDPKEVKKASKENLAERENDAKKGMSSALTEKAGVPKREHFRVTSQGGAIAISKTTVPGRKTSFNFYD